MINIHDKLDMRVGESIYIYIWYKCNADITTYKKLYCKV